MSDTNTERPGTPVAGTGSADDKERIAKVMARAGLCSRRDAEAWIRAGRVAVNGAPITSPALDVGPDDRVTVDGSAIEARERTRLFLYHKPRGLVTTAKDPEGRATVFDQLPPELPRLVSVGRLDINTEGLLLLTNDGGLARMLELPKTGWLRRYRVRANGHVAPERLEALKDGITIDGVAYAGIEAELDRQQGANVWLTMGLREGKNREIKRVLEHLGLYVNRLIRLSFGPFQLGDLAEGEVEEVRTRVLRDQLGEALAREAGVDWTGVATAEVVTQAVADRNRAAPAARGGKPRAGERGGREAAPAPRHDRPKPAARPHVSALRGERPLAGPDSPRKRVTRARTEDRKGRPVAVERITVEEKSRHTGEGGTSRNARNFARARRDALRPEGEPRTGRSQRRDAEPPARPRSPGRARAAAFGSDRPATGRALKDAKPRGTNRSQGESSRSSPKGEEARAQRRPRSDPGSKGRGQGLRSDGASKGRSQGPRKPREEPRTSGSGPRGSRGPRDNGPGPRGRR